MRRLYIIVEGQTEERFVKTLLAPYLLERHEIFATAILIRTSETGRGGFVNYQHLKDDALKFLLEQDGPVVSMLVDFFRCPDTPGKEFWERKQGHLAEVEERERQIALDINNSRFIPYIQLHEFEALLFSDGSIFGELFKPKLAEDLSAICATYPNPEDINSSPEGAPSKRLLAIVSNYDKVHHGELLAVWLGLARILARCPRFRAWVDRLIETCRD